MRAADLVYYRAKTYYTLERAAAGSVRSHRMWTASDSSGSSLGGERRQRQKDSSSGERGGERGAASELREDLQAFLRMMVHPGGVLQAGVMRQVEGGKARKLLVAAACLGAWVPPGLTSGLMSEFVRDSGENGSWSVNI